MIKVMNKISTVLNPIAVVISLVEVLNNLIFTGDKNQILFWGILFLINITSFCLRIYKED